MFDHEGVEGSSSTGIAATAYYMASEVRRLGGATMPAPHSLSSPTTSAKPDPPRAIVKPHVKPLRPDRQPRLKVINPARMEGSHHDRGAEEFQGVVTGAYNPWAIRRSDLSQPRRDRFSEHYPRLKAGLPLNSWRYRLASPTLLAYAAAWTICRPGVSPKNELARNFHLPSRAG